MNRLKNISKSVTKFARRPFLLMILVIIALFIIIMTSINRKYSVDFNLDFGEGIHFSLSPSEQNNLQQNSADSDSLERNVSANAAVPIE